MSITLEPTATEFINIEYHPWATRWSFQLPEVIMTASGAVKAWPPISPRWERLGDQAWGYEWRPGPEYETQVRAMNLCNTDGSPQYPDFVADVALRVRIESREDELQFWLTVTNHSTRSLSRVESDGGCLQARSEAFIGGEEAARSSIMLGGKMTGMTTLERTEPIRCAYRHDPAHQPVITEWFWGHCGVAIDRPAIVGAISRPQKTGETGDSGERHARGYQGRAIVLGYEASERAMQNGDEHHCLHSCPVFGDLTPGQSVTRRGRILFGSSVDTLAAEMVRDLAG